MCGLKPYFWPGASVNLRLCLPDAANSPVTRMPPTFSTLSTGPSGGASGIESSKSSSIVVGPGSTGGLGMYGCRLICRGARTQSGSPYRPIWLVSMGTKPSLENRGIGL